MMLAQPTTTTQRILHAACPASQASHAGPGSRYVLWWGGEEGMSSWRLSLAELMDFAASSNRTLVLPCVRGGRIVRHCNASRGSMNMSRYLDVPELGAGLMPPNTVVEFDTFRACADWRQVLSRVWRCYHASKRSHSGSCSRLIGRKTDSVGVDGRTISGIRTTLDKFVATTRHEQVVLILDYRRGAITRRSHLDEDHVVRLLQTIDYAPSCYKVVQGTPVCLHEEEFNHR